MLLNKKATVWLWSGCSCEKVNEPWIDNVFLIFLIVACSSTGLSMLITLNNVKKCQLETNWICHRWYLDNNTYRHQNKNTISLLWCHGHVKPPRWKLDATYDQCRDNKLILKL